MDFFSTDFFIFLISVLILINCARKIQYQQALLIGASYLFYWATSNYFVLLLLLITVISFQAGETIHSATSPSRKKAILIIGLVLLLIPLGFFKYYNFGIEILDQIVTPFDISLPFSFLNLVLPVGISFFTFSAISYVIDIYNGTTQPEKTFYRYALFISYFPHLLAGPIVRAGQFLPQLKNTVSLRAENLKIGVTIMVWGFVKKIVIADNCAPVVNAIFSNPTSFNSLYIIIGTIFFGIQIYCDFSGYIDIALGAAEMIGFHLPKNFNRPYLSQSPTIFWRRWNITLSSFIRDYIYIPLGGNRKGTLRTYANLVFSMLLCGLWHGAAWNFILWGGYHGVLQSISKLITPGSAFFSGLFPFLKGNFQVLLKILITQYFIFLGWIMFRVGNLDDLVYCVKKFVLIDGDLTRQTIGIPLLDKIIGLGLDLGTGVKLVTGAVLLICLIFLMHNDYAMKKVRDLMTIDWIQYVSSLHLKYWIVYLTIMFFLLLCLTPSSSPQFIYFQF